MPYATQQNIEERYGSDKLLLVADRDNDGVIDADAVTLALSDATEEINGYVAAMYSLPLPSTPEVLVRVCVDIAIYRLASTADILTEEIRKRYEDAVRLLKDISKGNVSLGMPDPPKSVAGGVKIDSKPRRFERGKGIF